MPKVGGPPLWLSMIVLQADWFSECRVTGGPRSSVSQLFGPGLLHNYIKAWSTGQPQHTGYKYDDNPSLHSCTVRALSAASYPCSCASMLKEALHQSPRVICVTSYINTHDGVSGFERHRSIFTGCWSAARVSFVSEQVCDVHLTESSGFLCGFNLVRITQMFSDNRDYKITKSLSTF